MEQLTRYKLIAGATSFGLFMSLCFNLLAWLSYPPSLRPTAGDTNSAETFQLICDNLQPSTELADALISLSSAIHKNCIDGTCTVSIEGGDGFYLDVCTIEYGDDYLVKTSSWIFGDD